MMKEFMKEFFAPLKTISLILMGISIAMAFVYLVATYEILGTIFYTLYILTMGFIGVAALVEHIKVSWKRAKLKAGGKV